MKYFFSITIIIATIFSCNKQEDTTIDKFNDEAGNFLPLAVGNYWIYEVNKVDIDGNTEFVNMDSTYIYGDTLINNLNYFCFKSSSATSYNQYLRDSSDYIVDQNGQRFLYQMLTNDTLYTKVFKNYNGDTVTFNYRLMLKPSYSIRSVIGEFICLDAEMNRFIPYSNINKKAHYYYSSNIGLVYLQDFFDYNGFRKEYSLVRYKINY